MRFGRYGCIIGGLEPPPFKPLAKPSADIFGAALLCGSPNLGKAIGIGFDRFALHCAAPYEGDEKCHATKIPLSISLSVRPREPQDPVSIRSKRQGLQESRMGLPVNAVPMQLIDDAGFSRYMPLLRLHDDFRGPICRSRILRGRLRRSRLGTLDRCVGLRRLRFCLFRNLRGGIGRSQAQASGWTRVRGVGCKSDCCNQDQFAHLKSPSLGDISPRDGTFPSRPGERCKICGRSG
jgi:hypothetical protein